MPGEQGKNFVDGSKSENRNVKRAERGYFSTKGRAKQNANLIKGRKPFKVRSTKPVNPNVSKLRTIIPGNRIVNFSHLAKQLICNNCHEEIKIQNIVHETVSGLSSIITVMCQSCKSITNATTSKTSNSSHGRPLADINKKAVLG